MAIVEFNENIPDRNSNIISKINSEIVLQSNLYVHDEDTFYRLDDYMVVSERDFVEIVRFTKMIRS